MAAPVKSGLICQQITVSANSISSPAGRVTTAVPVAATIYIAATTHMETVFYAIDKTTFRADA
jgi:hypothetical protein